MALARRAARVLPAPRQATWKQDIGLLTLSRCLRVVSHNQAGILLTARDTEGKF